MSTQRGNMRGEKALYIRMNMKTLALGLLCTAAAIGAAAQERTVQNRPYTDLRPFHFGIVIGTHLQDLELRNIGPQTVTLDDGTTVPADIGVDHDKWDGGFNVGILGEWRLSKAFQLRVAPTLYFGSRHLTYLNRLKTDSLGRGQTQSENMKTVYVGVSADMIWASERFNNHRPYLMAGVSPVINLSNGTDLLKLKRYDIFAEVGLGCDFYLPFFKLRPELKFMFSLTNSLDKGHADRLQDKSLRPYATAIDRTASRLVVLSFYFE